MSIEQIAQWVDQNALPFAGIILAMPVLAFLVGLSHKGRQPNPTALIFYSALVHLTCIPGIFAVIATAYAVFVAHKDMFQVSLVFFLLPVISMVATLSAIHRFVDLDAVPGFDRISGLMIMMGCAFLGAFILVRLHIVVVFFGGIGSLFLFALAIFLGMRFGMKKMMGPKGPQAA